MKCYHCDQRMSDGNARYARYGQRTVVAHVSCPRDVLVARARELGCVGDDAEQWSDRRLIDAIAAEQLSGEWLDRLDKLSTDDAKRDAIHRLRVAFELGAS